MRATSDPASRDRRNIYSRDLKTTLRRGTDALRERLPRLGFAQNDHQRRPLRNSKAADLPLPSRSRNLGDPLFATMLPISLTATPAAAAAARNGASFSGATVQTIS